MDEDDSVPDLEGWDPGEEMHANLIGVIDGVIGVIDGVQIHIMRPPDVANTKGWLHHLQLHKWWQNRHVKTANDGHDVEDGAVKSYQITK